MNQAFSPITRMLARTALTLGVVLFSQLAAPALATELPAGVVNYIRQKDPNAKIRFDGLVLFTNGESYVPVIPQDPSLNPDSQQVIATVPDKAAFPDLIQFDNNFFLIRLIQTSSGRLTFPKMAEYPIQMKEGLLPQDFVLPSNLYIPVELKVILGSLPYNPSFTPSKTPVLVAPAVALSQTPAAVTATPVQQATYVFDLMEQKVIAIDPQSGRKTGDIALDCVPSALSVSSDGKLLFGACLSSNELVAIDTGANLIKTRVPVGERPSAITYLPASQEVVISNRYSPFLSVINAQELVSGQKISLPGNGGVLALLPGNEASRLIVADAFKPQVYVVNMTTREVERTINTLPDISALQIVRSGPTSHELWVASRSAHQVQALDLEKGTVLKTLDVGKKPVQMAAYGTDLYVVSAGNDRLDVIDWTQKAMKQPVALPEGSFPSGISLAPSAKKAFITTAGAQNLVVFNLESGQLETTLPVEFRANMIAMTPDPQVSAGLAVPVSAVVQQPQQAQPAVTEEQPGKLKGKKKKERKPKSNKPAETAGSEKAAPAAIQQPSSKPSPAEALAEPVNNPALTEKSWQGGSRAPGGVKFRFGQGKSKQDKPTDKAATEGVSPVAGAQMPAAPPAMMEENIAK